MWFSALLTFECSVADRSDTPLRDETVWVIEANSKAAAREKASALGLENEHSYKNSDDEIVRWTFIGVEEIQDLCVSAIADGTEVYSRLSWASQAPTLRPPGGETTRRKG